MWRRSRRSIYGEAFQRFPKLADVFVNAGIERRYSVRPLEWFDQPHDWSERTEAYLDGAGELFVAAAQLALRPRRHRRQRCRCRRHRLLDRYRDAEFRCARQRARWAFVRT